MGFPGETEEDVQELLEFLEAHPFDRLGAFAFSVEEGTPAARMDGLPPEAERERRRDLVMVAQQSIAQRQQERRIGSEVDMLIEGVSEDGLFYTARSYGEAPGDRPPDLSLNEYPDDLSIGQIVKGKIITQEGYDLTALRVKDPGSIALLDRVCYDGPWPELALNHAMKKGREVEDESQFTEQTDFDEDYSRPDCFPF